MPRVQLLPGVPICRRGGTGLHSSLRSCRLRTCEFNSRRRHHLIPVTLGRKTMDAPFGGVILKVNKWEIMLTLKNLIPFSNPEPTGNLRLKGGGK